MSLETRTVERKVKLLDEIWSKIRPGNRLVVNGQEGYFVSSTISPEDPLGSFSTEAEAKAFAASPEHIEQLMNLVKLLLKERDESHQALREILEVVTPAYDDFNAQKPVDMAKVLKVTKQWCNYILNQ